MAPSDLGSSVAAIVFIYTYQEVLFGDSRLATPTR